MARILREGSMLHTPGTRRPSSSLPTLLIVVACAAVAVYFAFFLLMPFYSRIDKTKPEPERVTA